jgi:hypothetical protein
MEPDPWQVEVLVGNHRRLLLNCCRQAGKSTVVAWLSLIEALSNPGSLVLLLSRSLRQSKELFDLVKDFHERLRSPGLKRATAHELRLTQQSRIVSLPCKADTIRGFANVRLLVIDEAARVPDDLYRSVRPMLAVSGGRLVCLSTPWGRRGFFYDAWAHGGDIWHRIAVPASMVSRIRPEHLEEERQVQGPSWFRQEYECSFEALKGLVYTDFARCVVPGPAPAGRKVGGIDFGFANPFAAVWGVVDRDDVLWLTGEHYCRQRPLSYHAQQLPRGVRWWADPSGATEIAELRCASFLVSAGNNALMPGIAAVTARLESGRLKVVEGACPNLLAEAQLYRYATERVDQRSEQPVDAYNHALGALRYLVSKLDAHQMARLRKSPSGSESAPSPAAPPQPPAQKVIALKVEPNGKQTWIFHR